MLNTKSTPRVTVQNCYLAPEANSNMDINKPETNPKLLLHNKMIKYTSLLKLAKIMSVLIWLGSIFMKTVGKPMYPRKIFAKWVN